MAMTFVQTITVGSGGAASITFSNVAGTGKDLLVVLSGRNTVNEASVRVRLNSNTGNNYSYRMLYGNGGTPNNESATSQSGIIAYTLSTNNDTSNTFSSVQFYFANYTSSLLKNIAIEGVTENNNTTAYQNLVAANWNQTSAITSIELTALGTGGSFAQNSTASLYIIS
jgi:hypothetical protein